MGTKIRAKVIAEQKIIVREENPNTAFAWSLMIKVTGAVIMPNTC